MAIIDDVTAGMKSAMKARDKVRLGALRSIRAGLIEAMKADGSDTVSDEAALALLRKLAKSRQESIAAYTEGGRDDLVEAEQAELAIIEEFLPALADEETTAAWVDEAIAATGASSMADMGKVMGMLMSKHKAEIDGKLANQLVKQRLG